MNRKEPRGMYVNETLLQELVAPFQYPVVYTRDALHPENTALRTMLLRGGADRPQRAWCVIDAGVQAAVPDLADQLDAYARRHADVLCWAAPPALLPGGEAAKNDAPTVSALLHEMLRLKLCRQSFIVVIGGGAVLDAAGYAASLAHRGLRVIRLPTTSLAQNDAGIGVKNGLNHGGFKNAVGTFHPPFAVINDAAWLHTLPDIHWIGGVSEAFKVALIKDADFFETLCRDATRYRARDLAATESMIRHCARLHLEHIRSSGDPFELGQARPLDFGHWAAHKLESLSAYRLSHGAAVACGVALDAWYAHAQGWLDTNTVTRLTHALMQSGFDLLPAAWDLRNADGALAVWDGIEDFREHLGGKLCITFPDGLGRRQEVHDIDRTQMEKALHQLRIATVS